MNLKSAVFVAFSVVVMAASTAADGALSSPTDVKVVFDAAGPAGMKIEGSTSELNVSDDGATIVVTVPLANLTTGISLRDHHMRDKYLEVPKYPATTLTIGRSGLKLPNPGEKVEADTQGTINLHGLSRGVAVHYEIKDDGATLTAHGTFRINMNDFGITVPVYLGITVKPDVDVSASFHVSKG